MTHNPADPFDQRTEREPILESFDFAVQGNDSAAHARRVAKLLSDVEGVAEVEPHPSDSRVRVTYDTSRTDPAAIHEKLLAPGYDASRRPVPE